jgi:hypothetical protein
MGIGNNLQAIGNFRAKATLYLSPFVALIFCICGFFILRASRRPEPPAPGPAPPPPNRPPPAAMGWCFICIGFVFPFLAYGLYKLTMSSPTFSKIQGAEGIFEVARAV